LTSESKQAVRDFWESESCGERYATGEGLRGWYRGQAAARYRLEPYIRPFAGFEEAAGKDVLEVGVGMGADHLEWARASPRTLVGMDLTRRAVEHTRTRLRGEGLHPVVLLADAERLPFRDGSFDTVYSWGVLHHSPDTPAAIDEIARVLRPSGVAKLMLYHRRSITGYLLWLRYALLAGRPGQSLDTIYSAHLESPGTQAFSVDEVRAFCSAFSHVEVEVQLSFGDLLQGHVGERHGGASMRIARLLWPRWLIRRWLARHGLMCLIQAVK
jgi:SAM-dependent methyltransferase